MAQDTRERLLEAAEALFAERGVAASKLRDITRRAQANIAAVNYHFGSKLGLLQALSTLRLRGLNEARLQQLAQTADEDAPRLETVLRAYIEPTVRLCRACPAFVKLWRRLEAEPSAVREAVFRDARLAETVAGFGRALARALPGAPLPELFWRMHFTSSALDGAWAGWPDPALVSGGTLAFDGDAAMVERLVEFSAAGLRACRASG